MNAEKVWPKDDSQHSPPKRELKKADSKQPSCDPSAPAKSMILDLYLFHIKISYSFNTGIVLLFYKPQL